MELSAIKSAIERSTRALSLKPALGKGTGRSSAKIVDGLTCEISEGNWKYTADMPESVGGNAKGPTPGVFGRAAFGSCLAIGYMMQAAKRGIGINALEVIVEADYDDGALFGTADLFPGYFEVRYTVQIDADTSEENILALIDEADRHSPYLDVFSRGQNCKRSVQILHAEKS